MSSTVAEALLPLFNSPDISNNTMVIARVAGTKDAPELFVTDVTVADGVTALVAKRLPPGEVTFQAKKAPEIRLAVEDAARSRRRLVLQIDGQPDRAVLNISRKTYYQLWLAIEA